MNRRESLKLQSASKNMYSENCFIDRWPIRFDELVRCTDLTQFRERQRVYFRCKLPTMVFLSIPQNHPLLSRVYWLHNSIFHLKKMDGPYFIATSPLVSYQFFHAHRNFTFMLCLFPWFCWINTLWKQDVLVWHTTRSGVTFDDNQYCHLYSKRLWAWYITLTIKVQHA